MSAKTLDLAVAMVASTGLAGPGSAPTAAARPGFAPAPMYHWCPGDDWHPEWGLNWGWAACHDDHHRDIDAADHSHDWSGPPLWYRP